MPWPLPPNEFFEQIANDFQNKVLGWLVVLFAILIFLQAITAYLLYELSYRSKHNIVLLNREDVKGWVEKAVYDELKERKRRA
jgi:hypothetical protein